MQAFRYSYLQYNITKIIGTAAIYRS